MNGEFGEDAIDSRVRFANLIEVKASYGNVRRLVTLLVIIAASFQLEVLVVFYF